MADELSQDGRAAKDGVDGGVKGAGEARKEKPKKGDGAARKAVAAPKAGTIHVGVIGLGFMGRTHLAAYHAARDAGADVKVVAIADKHADRLNPSIPAGGNIDTNKASKPLFDAAGTKAYEDWKDLLADENVHAVSVCTPTDTHKKIVLAALKAGKDVLVEKPVALSAKHAAEIARAEKKHGRVCMPAMCMRFWPGWTWLKDRVGDKSLGKLRALSLERLGSAPSWAPEFYMDEKRSGHALFDLHVHDADVVLWLLGRPKGVSSTGTSMHVATTYQFKKGGPSVLARGGWLAGGGLPFRMRFVAEFQHATADFDLSRETPLMLAKDGQWTSVDLPAGSGYEHEVRHFLEAVAARREGRKFKRIVPASAAKDVAEVLAAERKSLKRGKPVRL